MFHVETITILQSVQLKVGSDVFAIVQLLCMQVGTFLLYVCVHILIVALDLLSFKRVSSKIHGDITATFNYTNFTAYIPSNARCGLTTSCAIKLQ